MHTKRKGKSRSKKPTIKTIPSWITHDSKEVEALVAKLSKQGLTASQIGLVLRDSYGVPDVETLAKKKVTDILKENKLNPTVPEDLQGLIKRIIRIKKHMEHNKKDLVTKHGLQLTEAKIARLVEYYKRKKMLPDAWKYNPDKGEFLLR